MSPSGPPRVAAVSVESRADDTLYELQEALGLKVVPRLLVCFDISHIQGTEVVGSAVVFQNGEPRKAEYRRFRIRGDWGNDDFRSMAEVVGRYLRRRLEERLPLPELAIIDGRKGQLRAAVSAAADAGVTAGATLKSIRYSVTNIEALRVNGLQGSDTFNVTPISIPIFLDGGDPPVVLSEVIAGQHPVYQPFPSLDQPVVAAPEVQGAYHLQGVEGELLEELARPARVRAQPALRAGRRRRACLEGRALVGRGVGERLVGLDLRQGLDAAAGTALDLLDPRAQVVVAVGAAGKRQDGRDGQREATGV